MTAIITIGGIVIRSADNCESGRDPLLYTALATTIAVLNFAARRNNLSAGTRWKEANIVGVKQQVNFGDAIGNAGHHLGNMARWRTTTM